MFRIEMFEPDKHGEQLDKLATDYYGRRVEPTWPNSGVVAFDHKGVLACLFMLETDWVCAILDSFMVRPDTRVEEYLPALDAMREALEGYAKDLGYSTLVAYTLPHLCKDAVTNKGYLYCGRRLDAVYKAL